MNVQNDKTINLLRKSGVRLLAIDFDNTLLSFHTGGAWNGSIDELIRGIRPFLAQLIDSCLKTDDIFVAIVTFSPQRELICSVMQNILAYV